MSDGHPLPGATTGESVDWRPLEELLLSSEEWLVDRFFHYAVLRGYGRYTSTLREAWRQACAGCTGSLLESLRAWQTVPELGPEEDFERDPSARFGQIEARRHRERGTSLTMFLGLLKYFRQSYHDLLAVQPGPIPSDHHQFVDRAFDRFELGFLAEWTARSRDELLAELQDKNRRLANEKNKYLTIFESIGSPVLFVSEDGRLENMNHCAAVLLLGEQDPGTIYYREGGLSAHLPWLVPWLKRFDQAEAGELGFEIAIATTGGRRHFEGRMRRSLDVSCKFQGTIVVLNDVTERERAAGLLREAHDLLETRVAERTAELSATAAELRREMEERRRAEAEREAARRQLHHAQKLEAIGTLAGGVAHDLNNLLQMILGNTELIAFKVPGNAQVVEMAGQVLHASERAATLVRQLLLFSRRQPMRFEPLDLSALVDGMTKMLVRLLGEPVTLTAICAPDLPAVNGDAGSLEQVLMNLVVNARDAMPSGGRITVRVERARFTDQDGAFPGVKPGDYLCLVVEDEGVGMDEATLERIFEPFFTTKPPERGTGLGLAVVYGIVEEHGGWIKVYSEPGLGSTFRVYLPALAAEGAAHVGEQVPLDALRGHGERLLLVEDEPGVRAFAAAALAQHGYAVVEAADGPTALNLDEASGPFDLVVSDVILPGMTGPAMISRLRERHAGQRVLYASGYTAGEATAVLQGRDQPMLAKPFGLRALLQAVREALGA